jgi:transposase
MDRRPEKRDAAARKLIEELQRENAALQRQQASLQERSTSLEQERAALAEQRASLEGRYTSLEQERAELARQLDEQRRVLDATAASFEDLRQQHEALRDELALYRRWVYGPRRERIVEADGQQHLFEMPSVEPPVDEPEEEQDRPSRRRRRRRSRKADLDRLPQRRIEHDLSEDEKQCGACGREMSRIGTEESRVLNYRPALLEVEVHVRPKYACSCCKQGVVSPPPPRRVFDRCIAGPGLISHLLVSKFADHLPLYRQEDILVRCGIHLPRSTLCDWLRSAADLPRPSAVNAQRRREQSGIRVAAWSCAGLVIIQLFIAAAMVEMRFPPLLRSAHQATGVLVWVATFALAAMCTARPRALAART